MPKDRSAASSACLYPPLASTRLVPSDTLRVPLSAVSPDMSQQAQPQDLMHHPGPGAALPSPSSPVRPAGPCSPDSAPSLPLSLLRGATWPTHRGRSTRPTCECPSSAAGAVMGAAVGPLPPSHPACFPPCPRPSPPRLAPRLGWAPASGPMALASHGRGHRDTSVSPQSPAGGQGGQGGPCPAGA